MRTESGTYEVTIWYWSGPPADVRRDEDASDRRRDPDPLEVVHPALVRRVARRGPDHVSPIVDIRVNEAIGEIRRHDDASAAVRGRRDGGRDRHRICREGRPGKASDTPPSKSIQWQITK